jgi:integrase
MKAWIFQDSKQKKKHGDKAPWFVGWYWEGKKESQSFRLKTEAKKYRRQLEGEVAAGIYRSPSKMTWQEFRGEYEFKVASHLQPRSVVEVKTSLNHFERIIKPVFLRSITTKTIDMYITQRRKERGRKPESTVAPHTIKKETAAIQAALNVALDWGYIDQVPKFRKIKVFEAIPRPVTLEHFDDIYQAAEVARMPRGLPVDPADWWRAIFMFAATTGWRKEEVLQFRREDLDLETGRVLTRADDNKNGRDHIDFLPETTVEHIRRVVSFHPEVFCWSHCHHVRTFDEEFHRIQWAAGIDLPCIIRQKHRCTPTCSLYGLHDLRRMYATENANRIALPVLQKKMRHKDIATTMGYINMAGKMKRATDDVFVPEVRNYG